MLKCHLGVLMLGIGEFSYGKTCAINNAAIARIFAHEVLAFLVSRELISPEIREKILSRRHTGFNTYGPRAL